jgi:hypothetical protein
MIVVIVFYSLVLLIAIAAAAMFWSRWQVALRHVRELQAALDAADVRNYPRFTQ